MVGLLAKETKELFEHNCEDAAAEIKVRADLARFYVAALRNRSVYEQVDPLRAHDIDMTLERLANISLCPTVSSCQPSGSNGTYEPLLDK